MVGRIVPRGKFFVEVAGNTNGTHAAFVSQIQSYNYVEVRSPQDSDFILVFCPVVSRVGTDIGEALQNLDPNKAKVLVVMHHTFNPNVALAESRRQVKDPNVLLTVDCLFYQSELLSCERNNTAWGQICSFLGIPSPPVTTRKSLVFLIWRHREKKSKEPDAVLVLIIFLLSFQSSSLERLTNCLKNNVWIVIAVLFATAVIFCWSLYGTSLWIAIAVAFAGAVILFLCKTQFGINNNSVLAIAVVFSGAVITLPGVLYSR
ncbi:uncharacterized protein LOC142879672 isoform X1 [Nelusetta ayraudi]|uniref:uncharacterized protein LOC142879672 isoform X1 n=1 Tax=Nelusetta ayraudi TaxID=303726 RepID=UPI003F7007C3